MVKDSQRIPSQIREVSPCKGFTEKFTACHDRCPKDERGEFGYKAWKGEIKRVKQTREEYLKRNAKKYISYGGYEDGNAT